MGRLISHTHRIDTDVERCDTVQRHSSIDVRDCSQVSSVSCTFHTLKSPTLGQSSGNSHAERVRSKRPASAVWTEETRLASEPSYHMTLTTST